MKLINKIKSKRWLYISLQILLLIAVYLSVRAYTQRDLVRDPPAFSATLLSGQMFNLPFQQQEPLLLHFWASWCPVCKLEQDSIQSISQQYSVVTVAMQSGEQSELKEYMRSENLSFPVITDNDGRIATQYGVKAVPVSFILNPDGKIVFTESGFTSSWGLQVRLWLANYL